MRTLCAALAIMAAIATPGSAHADQYRWCAVYGSSGDDNGTNCYFMTLEQCHAAISGNGGFCTHNNFYDGRPTGAREPARRHQIRKVR